jgi:hypothetical protein
MTGMEIFYAVSADGRSVAEAEVEDLAGARELVAAARAAGSLLAWAHCAADLSSLGFEPRPGFRRLTGPSRPGPLPDGVSVLSAAEDTAELNTTAWRGQWGHKSPLASAGVWPVPGLEGTPLLGLRRAGRITGICRLFPAEDLIDAPGLLEPDPDAAGYALLLSAGLTQLSAAEISVYSWGDGPERVRACTELGLETAEYTPGWELELSPPAAGPA